MMRSVVTTRLTPAQRIARKISHTSGMPTTTASTYAAQTGALGSSTVTKAAPATATAVATAGPERNSQWGRRSTRTSSSSPRIRLEIGTRTSVLGGLSPPVSRLGAWPEKVPGGSREGALVGGPGVTTAGPARPSRRDGALGSPQDSGTNRGGSSDERRQLEQAGTTRRAALGGPGRRGGGLGCSRRPGQIGHPCLRRRPRSVQQRRTDQSLPRVLRDLRRPEHLLRQLRPRIPDSDRLGP